MGRYKIIDSKKRLNLALDDYSYRQLEFCAEKLHKTKTGAIKYAIDMLEEIIHKSIQKNKST